MSPFNAYFISALNRDLLDTAGDDAVLGVILIDSATLQFFRAKRQVSAERGEYPSHSHLQASGTIPVTGVLGFSMVFREGKLRRFYRNSVLNASLPIYALGHEEVDIIIALLGVQIATDFEVLP